MNRTCFGTLNFASCPRQCSTSSSGVTVACLAHDGERHRDLSPPFVRSTDDRDLDDRFVLVEHTFHLGARDVLAAGHDHVLQPIDDEEIPVVVLHADVAGVEPATCERLARRLGIAPVALEDLGTA